MKGKTLLLLLVLVGALGYAGYRAFQGNRESWSQTSGGAGGKVVEFPINDVTQVQIKSSSAEVNLAKGDEWLVKERADYPASYEQVSELLRKLWDLKTVQEVKVGPSQLGRMELIEPGKGDSAGTLIEFKDKDGKSLASLLLGKKHLRKSEGGMDDEGGFPAGRYVMPLKDKAKVSLVSETLDQYEPKPERWLRKDFIKVENPKSVTLTGTTDAMKWTLTRESATAEWKLADVKPDESLDSTKVSSFNTAFSSPSFKDVLAPDAKPDVTGLDKPSLLKVETFDGFTYLIEVGKLADEAYPVRIKVSGDFKTERTPGKDEKPEDKTKLDEAFKTSLKKLEDKLAAEKKFESRIYSLEKFALDSLLKERTALLAEKKPETAATPVPGATPPAPGAPPFPPALPRTREPITVTTPPVSVPAATSEPVPVPPAPPEPPKPAPPAPPMPATPPTPPVPDAKPSPAPEPSPPVTPPSPVPAPEPEPPAKPAPEAAPANPPPAPPQEPKPDKP
jgi:hypothetical protein